MVVRKSDPALGNSTADVEKREVDRLPNYQAVKAAMKHCWDGYRKYAWGYDELKPVTKTKANNWLNMGATIVDSLDTLYIMGLEVTVFDAFLDLHVLFQGA